MKSRTIEIIDNHIKALEEELEWYQKKNIEWQEKCDTLEDNLKDLAKTNLEILSSNAMLRASIASLRDQLRWRDVGELPEKVKIGSSCISRAVILKEEKCRPKTAYFDYDNFMWVNLSTMKVIVLGYESKATWCYIPEDGDA